MNQFDSESFGRNICALRTQMNLNKKQLSDFTDISPANISRIENGEIVAKMDTVCKLADFFNVSIDYLCNRNMKEPHEDGSFISISSDAGLSQEEAKFVKKVAKYIAVEISKKHQKNRT